MPYVSCFRNRDNSVLSQDPGEGQLGAATAVPLCRAGKPPVPSEMTSADGRMCHDRNTPLPAPWKKVALDVSPAQIVGDLIYLHQFSHGNGREVLQIADEEISDTPIAYFSGASECLKAVERFGERDVASPMQQKKINSVRTKC